MAMYKKVDTSMDFVGREKEVEKFWKDNDIFMKSIKEHEGDPSYVFMTDRPRQTESRISVMFSPDASRTWFRDIRR